ncbi:probable serine/threonine-protein kinase PBL21 [Abrus precatorius]|uniref:Probable serine/threonine-protein kinase PBL21 n=1 Tax=Abrus precatorius TaxID=3816 RepID=A0A8B8LV68_ABRPR|nr:probable serine/threonine-protein kinase PBL21 [Abrus precatorius]
MASWNWNWNRTVFPTSILLVCMFILINTMKFAISLALDTECSLKIQLLNDSSCQEGNWHELMHSKCCGEAFDSYLYALAQHANLTGRVYLDSTEQRNCLSRVKGFKDDIFGCGIENLTSGGGGCSDLLVADVWNKLGNELKSLDEKCQFQTSGNGYEQSCSLCLRPWKTTGETSSRKTNVKAEKIEDDLCRIAVIVTLISSKIENEMYVHTVLRCLGTKHIYIENETTQGNQNMESNRGTWILIGATIGVILMIVIAYSMLRRCFRSAPPRKEVTFGDMLKKTSCPRVHIKEVYAATNHLNEMNIIGEGSAGKVYKGTMRNNQHVAIKHVINDDGNMETFAREVTSLSHVRHPNLVALLGYCVEGDECFLVYELCPNGSLSEWLFGKNKVLSWIQRLEIAIDSARGLWFLHTYAGGCIVHRDIKPTNILLGSKFEAKLSDFGLSKVIEVGETYVSSEVRGTFGYVDPEYQSNHHVNSSGDVYSFGMVLLQILSGKKVINLKLKKPMSLNKMAKAITKGGSITGFVDPKLQGDYSGEAFDFTLKLALSCTSLNQQRPSMEQVVQKLEEALLISKERKASTTKTPADDISNP